MSETDPIPPGQPNPFAGLANIPLEPRPRRRVRKEKHLALLPVTLPGLKPGDAERVFPNLREAVYARMIDVIASNDARGNPTPQAADMLKHLNERIDGKQESTQNVRVDVNIIDIIKRGVKSKLPPGFAADVSGTAGVLKSTTVVPMLKINGGRLGDNGHANGHSNGHVEESGDDAEGV